MITNSTAMLSRVLPQGTPELAAKSSKAVGELDFASMFSNVSSEDTEVSANESIKTEPKEDLNVKYEKENIKPSKEVKEAEEPAEEVISEEIQKLYAKVKNLLMENFNISEEELLEALESLGMTMMDMLEPGNVMQLMMQLTQVDNPLEIITDAQLSDAFKSVNTEIASFVEAAADNLDMPVEKFVMKAQSEDVFIEEFSLETDNIASSEVVQPENSELSEKSDDMLSEQKQEETVPVKKNDDGNVNMEGVINKLDSAVRETFTAQNTQLQPQVDVENIIRQINEAVKVNVLEEGSSIELQLQPENLGKVNIQVVSKNGVLTATIQASDEVVKKVLETQMISLKDNLNSQGIKVEAVEVTVETPGFESQENEKSNKGNESQNQRRRGFILSDEADEEPVQSNDDLSESIVNYRA